MIQGIPLSQQSGIMLRGQRLRIGLLNLEPKYKNLAIEKLRLYHQGLGDEAEDYFALRSYDKVYVSSIFTFTPKHIVPSGAVCGGTGLDLATTLPPEVDAGYHE